MASPVSPTSPVNPVTVSIPYSETLSRGKLILKVLLGWLYVGIPHGIILYFYALAAVVVTFIAFWAILFTGKYPRGMYEFVVGYYRWSNRVAAYMNLLRDEYPPFSGAEHNASTPVDLTVPYAETLSRGKLLLKVFLGIFYVWIPHGVVLALYEVVVAVVTFIAFWVILFTAKYPKGMYEFVVGYFRWSARVSAYMFLLRDEYPPFSNKE